MKTKLAAAAVLILLAWLVASTDASVTLADMRIESVIIESADVRIDGVDGVLDRRVTIHGAGFFGTAFGPFVFFERADGSRVEAAAVILQDENTVLAWPPAQTYGPVTIVVENPDHERVTRVARL
jgi:hypothetical protein